MKSNYQHLSRILSIKTFFILFLFCIFLTSYGQERLSDIEGAGIGQRHFLKEYDGTKYIIKVDRFDSVKVYMYTDEATTYLHGQKYISAYKAYSGFQTTDQYLLLEGSQESIAYNFVNNTELVFPYAESITHTSWYNRYKDEVVLRQSTADFNQRKQWFLNLATGEQTEIPNEQTILDVTENTLYIRTCESNELCYHMTMDKTSGEIDTMARLYLYSGQYNYSEEKYVYLQGNTIKVYDLENHSTSTLFDIPGELAGFGLFVTQNHYIIRYRADNVYYFMVVQKNDLSYILEEVYVDINSVQYEEVFGKIILGDLDIYTYDIEKKELAEIESNSRLRYTTILDHRYLVHSYFNKVRILDIKTMEFIDSAPIRSSYGNEGITYFSIENGYLINYDITVESEPSLYKINLDSKIATIDTNTIPYVQAGLEPRAKIFQVGDDIVALGNDLYLIEDDQVTKLNEGPIVESEYEKTNIINGKLYWSEKIDSDVFIFSLNNGVKVEEGQLPVTLAPNQFLNIGDYAVTDKYIYYEKSEFLEMTFVKIDKLTNEVTDITELFSFTINPIFSIDNYVYYINNGINAIDEEGNTVTLDIPLDFVLLPNDIIFQDELYYQNTDGIYKITGLEATRILDLESVSISNPSIIGDMLFIGNSARDTFYILKEGIWDVMVVPEDSHWSPINEEFGSFLINIGTNRWITSLYHHSTKTMIDIPTEFDELRIENIFQNFGKNIILATSGFFPNQIVHLIEMSNDFLSFDKIGEFDSSGQGIRSTFTTFENEGFLYAGSRLFLMNEELEFVPLDPSIGGDSQSVDVVKNEDGYFYFIAFHPTKGRQIYSILVFSKRVSESTSDIDFPSLTISPNPTSGNLELSLENGTKYSYQIFDLLGKVVQSGIMNSNQISVDNLSNGQFYILTKTYDGKMYKGKFIKL